MTVFISSLDEKYFAEVEIEIILLTGLYFADWEFYYQ